MERKDFLSLNFYKKEVFTGSCKGMRFRVSKTDDLFTVDVWPEPYCFACTPEEEKQQAQFPFSEEGMLAVVDYLNSEYERQKERWSHCGIFA